MEVTRTFDIVDYVAEKYDRPDFLAVKRRKKWYKLSTSEYKAKTKAFSIGLLELNLGKGTKIASISNNRPEWNVMDMGIAQAGGIHVPIYPNISKEELEYILKNSDASVMIVSSIKIYKRIKSVVENIDSIKKVYSFDDIPNVENWEEIIKLGKEKEAERIDDFNKLKAEIKPDDICSIIYTSGTTGTPKGVMISHNNFISNVKTTVLRINAEHGDIMLSFLPLCHVFERMVNYLFQYNGNPVYYAESVETLVANIKEVQPVGFTSVPRVLEKIYDKIILNGRSLKPIQKSIFFWAIHLGHRYELNNANGWWYNLQLKIADKLIFHKWRDLMGNNIKFIVSGGAALQPRLAKIFTAAGLTIQQGYGLTETSPVIAVSRHFHPYLRFDSVGQILENLEVKIAEDGEILVKGPSVMKGYYKDPELTKEVIDEDGWFHTGDVGVIHEHNMLQITDRKKSMFKLSTGKYIHPQLIENKIKESPFIEQVMVVGENEKFATALICPAFEYLHGWCMLHDVKFRDNKKLIKNPQVVERIKKEINKLNKELGQHEKVKKFELIDDEWTTESGELSPTLKLKRSVIAKKYKAQIEVLYNKNLITSTSRLLSEPEK